MANKRTYAVFGLSSYGWAVAKELVDNGAEVLAVDNDAELINAAITEIPFCITMSIAPGLTSIACSTAVPTVIVVSSVDTTLAQL